LKPRDLGSLVLLSLLWGSAFLFIDVIVEEVEPLTTVAARLLIASLVLAPAAWLTRSGLPPPSAWGAVALMAVLNNAVPFSLITAAQEHIDSSLAAALIGTMPLFVLLLTMATGTESPTWERSLGLGIGFVGAVVIVGPDLTDITDSSSVSQLAVLAASLSYAVSTVVARQWAHGPPLSLSAAQLVIAALVMAPIALIVEGPHDGGLSLRVAAALIALGIGGSGLAYLLFYALVQRLAATQVALVSYMIPVVAAMLGWAVLDERIAPSLFVGLALIIAGVAAVNGMLGLAVEAVRRRARTARYGQP